MQDRPASLELLDRHFEAARIAHEYIADLHRELVDLAAADDRTRGLLRESVVVTVERLPALTCHLLELGREWAEQELLDPPAAADTAERLLEGLADVEPNIARLRARQNDIAAELRDLLSRAS